MLGNKSDQCSFYKAMPTPPSKNTSSLFKRSVVILWDKPPPVGYVSLAKLTLCLQSMIGLEGWILWDAGGSPCQGALTLGAAFKGLTAAMTETAVPHHAVLLRDDALRLTCGIHWAGISAAEKHTPTRDCFSIFHRFNLSCCSSLCWCFTLFSPRSQKRI